MTPCFGEVARPLRWANSAFSAPRTCRVPDGFFANFSKPPAIEISLAARRGPAICVRLGAMRGISDSMKCASFSRLSERDAS